MSARSIRRLRRVDACYGIAAGTIIATGLLRVFLFGKGVDYYIANIVFWTKMVVFTAIGLLSIRPTMHFVRTERDAAPGGTITIAPDTYRRTQTLLWMQVGLFAIVPLLAALMARGIG
jgi:putative membrane protein